jgi:hypothetical protein
MLLDQIEGILNYCRPSVSEEAEDIITEAMRSVRAGYRPHL